MDLLMKILLVSNHFSLPHQPGAPRPWKVAHYLKTLGHDVTVITNRRHYFDENIEIGGTKHETPQVVEGIKIIGIRTTSGRRKSLFKRLLNYFSFSYMSYFVGSKIEKPDVIIVGTPPLLVPLTGLLLGKKHKAFTILEVRDLYPETAVALGKLKNRMVQSIWEWWENVLRKRYDHIVAVVPRIRKSLLEKGFPSEKVTTITNGFDVEHNEVCTLPSEIELFFQEHSDRFIIVYGGGMGYANNLMTILEAADLCKDENSIIFALFGEGEQKSRYVRYAREQKLSNCFFFGLQSRKVVNEIFRRSGALVQSFLDTEFHKCVFSNKIFEYHGAARPIVYAGRGDSAELIGKAGSGLVVEPENPQALLEAVKYLASHPKESEAMGHSGYEYIMQHYLREKVFEAWNDVLRHVRSV